MQVILKVQVVQDNLTQSNGSCHVFKLLATPFEMVDVLQVSVYKCTIAYEGIVSPLIDMYSDHTLPA